MQVMMMREQRAKQFLPFDAMKGLSEALRAREDKHSRVEKHEIFEEDLELISAALNRVEKGSMVFLRYYSGFHEREMEGIVSEINRPLQFLKLNEEKILFDDLYEIRVIG